MCAESRVCQQVKVWTDCRPRPERNPRMALFERENLDSGSDVASRALSVTAVENDFVERVYDKIAKVYDLTFGPTLHPGRLIALERMGIKPGDKVLEVGVGTGINVAL